MKIIPVSSGGRVAIPARRISVGRLSEVVHRKLFPGLDDGSLHVTLPRALFPSISGSERTATSLAGPLRREPAVWIGL